MYRCVAESLRRCGVKLRNKKESLDLTNDSLYQFNE